MFAIIFAIAFLALAFTAFAVVPRALTPLPSRETVLAAAVQVWCQLLWFTAWIVAPMAFFSWMLLCQIDLHNNDHVNWLLGVAYLFTGLVVYTPMPDMVQAGFYWCLLQILQFVQSIITAILHRFYWWTLYQVLRVLHGVFVVKAILHTVYWCLHQTLHAIQVVVTSILRAAFWSLRQTLQVVQFVVMSFMSLLLAIYWCLRQALHIFQWVVMSTLRAIYCCLRQFLQILQFVVSCALDAIYWCCLFPVLQLCQGLQFLVTAILCAVYWCCLSPVLRLVYVIAKLMYGFVCWYVYLLVTDVCEQEDNWFSNMVKSIVHSMYGALYWCLRQSQALLQVLHCTAKVLYGAGYWSVVFLITDVRHQLHVLDNGASSALFGWIKSACGLVKSTVGALWQPQRLESAVSSTFGVIQSVGASLWRCFNEVKDDDWDFRILKATTSLITSVGASLWRGFNKVSEDDWDFRLLKATTSWVTRTTRPCINKCMRLGSRSVHVIAVTLQSTTRLAKRCLVSTSRFVLTELIVFLQTTARIVYYLAVIQCAIIPTLGYALKHCMFLQEATVWFFTTLLCYFALVGICHPLATDFFKTTRRLALATRRLVLYSCLACLIVMRAPPLGQVPPKIEGTRNITIDEQHNQDQNRRLARKRRQSQERQRRRHLHEQLVLHQPWLQPTIQAKFPLSCFSSQRPPLPMNDKPFQPRAQPTLLPTATIVQRSNTLCLADASVRKALADLIRPLAANITTMIPAAATVTANQFTFNGMRGRYLAVGNSNSRNHDIAVIDRRTLLLDPMTIAGLFHTAIHRAAHFGPQQQRLPQLLQQGAATTVPSLIGQRPIFGPTPMVLPMLTHTAANLQPKLPHYRLCLLDAARLAPSIILGNSPLLGTSTQLFTAAPVQRQLGHFGTIIRPRQRTILVTNRNEDDDDFAPINNDGDDDDNQQQPVQQHTATTNTRRQRRPRRSSTSPTTPLRRSARLAASNPRRSPRLANQSDRVCYKRFFRLRP